MRAGVPLTQKPVMQFQVGNNPKRAGTCGYVYSGDQGQWGNYWAYETPQGSRLVVEQNADPDKPPHFHAAKPPDGAPQRNYDFRAKRYLQMGPEGQKQTHHHYNYARYNSCARGAPVRSGGRVGGIIRGAVRASPLMILYEATIGQWKQQRDFERGVPMLDPFGKPRYML